MKLTVLTVSEGRFELKAISRWTIFRNFCSISSYLQTKTSHENEIAQYLQNYKCQEVNQSHFRKPLQGSTNVKKSYYFKTSHTF